MRFELRLARLREDQRRYAVAVQSAALDLIKHQDAVAELASVGRATPQDRVGLNIAQFTYDKAAKDLKSITDQLLTLTDP